MKFRLLNSRYKNTDSILLINKYKNGGFNIWRAKMRINTEFG